MHKKIGIIGGLSPESTMSYYLHITRSYSKKFNSLNFPEIIIYSVDLEKYHYLRSINRWDLIAKDLIRCGKILESSGAELGLIATNTMHKVFDDVQKCLDIPFINIIDSTAKAAEKKGCKKLGLLGTKYTMSDGFYQKRFEKFDIPIITPEPLDQDIIHNIIVDELVKGVFKDKSKKEYLRIINNLNISGADGIILGCTEIPLLVKNSDSKLPLFDTAVIHADEALNLSIAM